MGTCTKLSYTNESAYCRERNNTLSHPPHDCLQHTSGQRVALSKLDRPRCVGQEQNTFFLDHRTCPTIHPRPNGRHASVRDHEESNPTRHRQQNNPHVQYPIGAHLDKAPSDTTAYSSPALLEVCFVPCLASSTLLVSLFLFHKEYKIFSDRLGGLENRENRMTDQGVFQGREHRHALLA